MFRPFLGLIAGITGVALLNVAKAESVDDCLRLAKSDDLAPSIRCLQPLAEAGNVEAEWRLGAAYRATDRFSRDMAQSVFWTEKAAEGGDHRAQRSLAEIYQRGDGVPADLSLAFKWYRIASDGADEIAEYELARMYLEGSGTPRDAQQAIFWERKVADQGGERSEIAELDLAGIYLHGDGVSMDYQKAAGWYRKAASAGSPIAYLDLARMEDQGLVSGADPLETYEYYSIAFAWLRNQGMQASFVDAIAKRRDIAASKLSAEQKAEADRFTNWREPSVH